MNTDPKRPHTARALECDRCGSAVKRDSVYRLSSSIAIIGYLILIPSIISLAILLCIAIPGLIAALQSGDNAPAATLLGGGITAAFATPTIVGLLAGLLLTMKRRVWRCGMCDSIWDRA